MEKLPLDLPPLFEQLHVGITVHHPKTGAILGVNERLEEIYGYPAEELLTMEVGEYTAPSTKFSQSEAVQRIRQAADGETRQFEWKIERANGEFRWVTVILDLATIDGMECVIAEVHDITEFKSRDRLLQLLTRVVRHNLRNDMTVLIGYAERLKQAIEDDRLEEEVATILDVATEVGNLSDSIRQIEQITNPNATKRSPRNLSTAVESRVEAARSEFPSGEFSVDPKSDCWVTADEGLTYALDHAIRNAIQHNDRDEPSMTVTVDEDADNGLGVIRIADNGPPIPQIEIDAVDEGTETSSVYHGSGVGLWVMKWCVDSLGGELTFEERSPRGNVVCLSLPTIPDPTEPSRSGGPYGSSGAD